MFEIGMFGNDQPGWVIITLFMKCSFFSSLLLEDSEEEEGDLCRICQMAAASSSNLLIEPCKCTGSLQYVHQECMKKWLQAKINSGEIYLFMYFVFTGFLRDIHTNVF